MNYYKNLEVWKESIQLVTEVYIVAKKFPKEELYSLASQIKRCSVSIPSNIAEGAGRNGKKEFLNFLSIASGSCCELETQLQIALNLGFIKESELGLISNRIDKINRMIINLAKRLKESLSKD